MTIKADKQRNKDKFPKITYRKNKKSRAAFKKIAAIIEMTEIDDEILEEIYDNEAEIE